MAKVTVLMVPNAAPLAVVADVAAAVVVGVEDAADAPYVCPKPHRLSCLLTRYRMVVIRRTRSLLPMKELIRPPRLKALPA